MNDKLAGSFPGMTPREPGVPAIVVTAPAGVIF